MKEMDENEGMKIKFTFIFVEKLIQSKGSGLKRHIPKVSSYTLLCLLPALG